MFYDKMATKLVNKGVAKIQKENITVRDDQMMQK